MWNEVCEKDGAGCHPQCSESEYLNVEFVKKYCREGGDR